MSREPRSLGLLWARADWLPWFAALLLIGVVVVHVPTLDQPLLERHGWRQTQTAWTARVFDREGIDLLHPQVPVLGPPWVLPFEFPLFQAAAALVMSAGVPEDRAMRLTGLASFVLSAVLLFVLLLRHVGRAAAAIGLMAYVGSPFGLFWSRTSQIEYTAVAGCIAFAIAALEWRTTGQRRWWLLAVLGGTVGATVKITTALFWLLPFPLLGHPPARAAPESRAHQAAAWLLMALPLAAAAAWTGHADRLKAASPVTAGLTSQGLATWNFGTLEQRLDPAAWAQALYAAIGLAGGLILPVAVVVVVVAAWRRNQPKFWVWLTIALVAPIATFFNLYVEHDYYAAAVSPVIAAFLGGGAAVLLAARSRWATGLLLAGVLVFAAAWISSVRYWTPMLTRVRDANLILPKAEEIRRQTRPDQLVAVVTVTWSPELLYYADRRGVMLFETFATPARIEELRAEGYVVFHCPVLWGPGSCTTTEN